MHRPELLAPAGDDASLTAALQAGADAVYFGLDEGLNARARARNFALADLPQTCDRIHLAGARAYLTLNTLVFEEELATVEAVLRAVAAAGVDALIVQDPAVALLARRLAPTLEVHASTQMTISSPEAARFAAQLGVTRVVVPRELSLDEIARFARDCPLELEVFVHGALCVSWSGQCLTSEAWGGRSANRGQCAQSCRMPYGLLVDGEERELGEVAYLLSPQDLAAVRALPRLVELGVHGLKIEGRQKGPQYVMTAVQGYRRWIDAIVAGEHGGRVSVQRLQGDLRAMALSYSRGFSDGFLGGSDHQQLVEGRFPKHRGVLLGTVAETGPRGMRVVRAARLASGGAATAEGYAPTGEMAVALPAWAGADPHTASGLPIADPSPAAGMGIGLDTGQPESEEPGGALFAVEATPDGWWLRMAPGFDLRRVRVGHRVWLSGDAQLAREATRVLQAAAPEGRIAVDIEVSGTPGQPLAVQWTAQGPVGRGVSVRTLSEAVLSAAQGEGLDATLVRDKLGALGGTPFRLGRLETASLPAGLHVPVSALKALRRHAVSALQEALLAASRHAVAPQPVTAVLVDEAAQLHARRPWSPPDRPQLVPLVRSEVQLDAVIATGLPEVILDWMDLVGLTRAVDKARAAGLRVVLATVRVQKPGEDGIDRRLQRLAPDGVLVRHWGGLMHFAAASSVNDAPHVHGDFSLNVSNSVTAHHLWALGADTLALAHDLDEAQVLRVLERVPAGRVEVIVHHHIPTFHTEHCVYAHLLSHGRDFHSCGRPCERHAIALRDHGGDDHPVLVDVGCRNTVFNARAQSAASAVPRLLNRGVRRFRVELVREDFATTCDLLAAYRALLDGRIEPRVLLQQVQVHEQFGVTAGTLRTLARPS